MDGINVCYITDNGYFEYTIVSMYSMLQTKKPTTHVNCYVICGNLNDEYKNLFLRLNDKNFNVILIDIDINDIPFRKLDTEWSKYITNLTYARFMIPQLIKDIDKILYIDGDTIIKKDLSDLFSFNMKFPIYGVPDYSMNFKCKQWDKVQYIINEFKNNQYINAGILLLDIKKLNELDFLKNAIECYNDRPDFIFADQDILNFKFKDYIGLLHTKYNFQLIMIQFHKSNQEQSNYIEDIKNAYQQYYDTFDIALCDAVIVHLAGFKGNIYNDMLIYNIYESYYKDVHNFLLNEFINNN